MRKLYVYVDKICSYSQYSLCDNSYVTEFKNQTILMYLFTTASNFVYLNAVPTEMLTGPCAVQRAVSATIEKTPGSFTPTIVNLKASLKGVTLTDINRK